MTIEDVNNVNKTWRELISACNHPIMECQQERERN
jgi:hypothetical protein